MDLRDRRANNTLPLIQAWLDRIYENFFQMLPYRFVLQKKKLSSKGSRMLAMNFLQINIITQNETSDRRNVKAFALKLKLFFQYLISFVGKLPAVNSTFRKCRPLN